MIPKIIHYCWFGGKPLPRDVEQCIASWKKYCPDYEIQQWDESNFDVMSHPFMKAAYEAKAWAFVSDYARLQVVYENGGIYLDTDVELCKSLDELLHNGCYFGTQQVGKVVATGLGFGAEERHPGVLAMMREYDALSFDQDNKEAIACPILNTHAMEVYGYTPQNTVQRLNDIGVTIYPPEYFDPCSPGDAQDLTCEDTVSIHHYSASWTGGKNVLKRRLIRMIGEGRIKQCKALLKGTAFAGEETAGKRWSFDSWDLFFLVILLPLFKPVGLSTVLPAVDAVYDAARSGLVLFALIQTAYGLTCRPFLRKKSIGLYGISIVYQGCMLLSCALAGTLISRLGTSASCLVTVWVFFYLSKADVKRLFRVCANLLLALLSINLLLSLLFPKGLIPHEVPEARYQFLGKDNMYIWWALTATVVMHLYRSYLKKNMSSMLLLVITVTTLMYSSSTGTIVWLLVLGIFVLQWAAAQHSDHRLAKPVLVKTKSVYSVINKISFAKVMIFLGILNFFVVVLDVQSIFSGVIHLLTGKDASLSGRTAIWMTMKRLIAETPLLGTGKGESAIDAWLPWGETVLYAHNFILDVLVKGGIVAFVVFLVVMLVWNGRAKRLRRSNTAVYAICMLLLLAYGIDGMLEGFEDSTVFWAFLSAVYYYQPAVRRRLADKGRSVNG